MEIVESIGVRVLPDMKGFRADLERELKKINTDFTIDIKIGKVDTKAAQIQITEFRKFVESNDLSIHAKVDLDTKSADANLARMRAEGEKTAKSSDGLGGSFLRTALSIGKLGAGVGASTLKLGAMSVALVAATQAAGALVTTAAQMLPIVGLIPGAALAAGTSLAVVKLGLKGFSDTLKNIGDEAKFVEALNKLAPAAQTAARAISDLKPKFDTLQLGVQEALFHGVGEELRKLGDNLLPKLRAPLEGIAKVFGGMTKDVIAFLNQDKTWGDLKIVFQATEDTLKNVRQAIFPVLQGFKDIGTVGASMLPELTSGLGAAAQKFQDWAANARATGELQDIIKGAVEQFGKLLDIVKNVGGIVRSVFQAGQAGGSSFLDILAHVTGMMNDFFNSAQGATLLENIFTAIGGVMKGLFPLIQEVARVIGEFIGPALLKLGPAIGLAFNALKPAIEPLGKALAALAPLIGTVAYQFAKILGAAIIALSPVVEALVPPLIEVLQTFGKLVTGEIAALAPVLLELAKTISGFLLAALQKLAPILPVFLDAMVKMGQQLAGALADALPTLVKVAETLGQAFVDALIQIIPLLPALVKSFADILTAVIPLLPELAKLIGEALPQLIGILPELIPMLLDLTKMWVQLVKDLTPFITALIERLLPTFKDVKDGVIEFIGGIKPIFEGIGLWVKGVVDVVAGLLTGDWSRVWKGAGEMVAGVVKGIGGILDTLVNIIKVPFETAIKVVADILGGGTSGWTKTLKDFVSGIPGNVFGGIASLLENSGRALIEGFGRGIQAAFAPVYNGTRTLLSALRGLFPFSPAKEGPFSGKGYTIWSGRALAEDFAKGIRDNAFMAAREVDAMMTAAQLPLSDVNGFSGQLAGAVDHTLTVSNGAASDGIADAVREGLADASFTIDQNGVFKVSTQGGLKFGRR